jgi:hypothetical protein
LSDFQLFKSAIKLGLSAKNVNSAAGFFLHQIPGWENHLIEIKRGAKGKIFRPDLTLFIALKLGRATQIDLEDIAVAAKHWKNSEFSFQDFTKMVSPEVLKRFEHHRKTGSFKNLRADRSKR